MDSFEKFVSKLSVRMDVCRTCMNERGSELVGDDFQSIFSHLEEENVYIANCLAQWIGRTIDENDGMPSEICHPCLEAIKSIALFIENAKECDGKLRSRLGLDEPQDKMISYVDVDVKIESEEISTNEPSDILVRDSDEEQSTEQEDVDPSSHGSDDEERPTRRRRRRKSAVEAMNELDEKEQETYNIIEVQGKQICCGCHLLFDTEADLELHGKTTHRRPGNISKKHVCKYCYKRFKYSTQRQVHRERFESFERVYECKKCNKHIVNPESRYKHAHNHPEWTVATPTMYLCSMARLQKYGYLCCVRNCASAHSTEDSLLEHVKKEHGINTSYCAKIDSDDIQCPFCLRLFESKEKLRGHYDNRYVLVSRTRGYQCHECGNTYSTPWRLKAHENKHANIRPHECDICAKTFCSKAGLTQHKLIHTEPKAWECTICGRTFRKKEFLTNHQRIHSDDKPFECDICSKSFKHPSSLFTHSITHNPDLYYKCSECGKGFSNTANRKRHMVTHTGIKPYQCHHCDKRFMRLSERSEHESKVHMGIMPYACEACGKQFTSKRAFQNHQNDCGGEAS